MQKAALAVAVVVVAEVLVAAAVVEVASVAAAVAVAEAIRTPVRALRLRPITERHPQHHRHGHIHPHVRASAVVDRAPPKGIGDRMAFPAKALR